MFSYNITFIVAPDVKNNAADWISQRLQFFAASSSFAGTAVSLSEVVQVPGMPEYGSDSVSITAQLRFRSLDDACAWGASRFQPLANAFAKQFGPEALAMPSIMQNFVLHSPANS